MDAITPAKVGKGWPRTNTTAIAYTPATPQFLNAGQLAIDRTISLYVAFSVNAVDGYIPGSQ